MPAGEELDRMVAERVMGRRWLKNTKGAVGWACVSRDAVDGFAGDEWDGVWVDPTTPDYSTNIAHAWEVVEHLLKFSRSQSVSVGYHPDHGCYFATVDSGAMTELPGPITLGDTAPLAICRAALKALA
jgi:hypothetical protein